MRNVQITRPEVRRETQETESDRPIINDGRYPQSSAGEESMDLNNDGVVSTKEEEIYEKRAKNRRAMAWLSLITLIISAFVLMFLVPEKRLAQLNGLLELYWISLGGVVGAYVGISTWLSRR